MTNGTPPPPPGAAAKKGLSPLAWVAIGCGGLVLLGVLAFVALGAFVFQKGKEIVAETTGNESVSDFFQDLKDDPAKTTAELAIRVNPDLKLIETDDEAGTITFENTRTGEEATLNFEDIAEGRFSMTTSEGDYSVDASDGGEGGVTFKGPEGETRFGASADLSDVPDWVPSYPGAANLQGTFHSSTATAVSGAMSFQTKDSAQDVVDHFKRVFEDADYEISGQSMTTTPQGAFAGISGTLDEGRSVNVGIIEQGGECRVTINYNQKKSP